MLAKRGAARGVIAIAVTAVIAASCGNAEGTRHGGPGSSAGAANGASASADGGEPGGASSVGMDASIAGTGPDGSAGGGAGTPLRVLFVGNSYTYVNDLPAVILALGAATPGGAIEAEAIAPGAATLADHWLSTGARPRIEQGGLDVVLLQGQSLEATQAESFVGYGALLSGAAAAAGARAVWFATWARREGDPVYTELGLMDPAYMTRRIEQAYVIGANQHGDVVARVGAAWQIAHAEMPGVVLHADDGSHPSPAGTLLAACVIFQAITGQTPRLPEPPPLDIPSATASALCAIAPRVRCLDGINFCGGACVNIGSNPEHCGACDVACPGEDPCRARGCGCDSGLSGCDRTCVDLQTDPNHCGDCDTTCSAGAACDHGECRCPNANVRPITLEALAAVRPACDFRDDYSTLDCAAATHEICAALDCHDSGFGPPAGHAPVFDAILCLPGDVRTITYDELATVVPACDGVTERRGQACTTAIHRYCVSTGAVSGFGPVTDSSGYDVTVTCVPSGTVVATTYAALAPLASRCTPDPVTCAVTAWSFCASLGYAGGFGPIEVSGDARDVVCFDP